MPKVDDGIHVTSSTLSHIIGGLPSLDTMGVVGALSMAFVFFSTFPMACPFVAFNYAKTFSFCSTSFSLPFSLEVFQYLQSIVKLVLQYLFGRYYQNKSIGILHIFVSTQGSISIASFVFIPSNLWQTINCNLWL
jgi:hypothetical protein